MNFTRKHLIIAIAAVCLVVFGLVWWLGGFSSSDEANPANRAPVSDSLKTVDTTKTADTTKAADTDEDGDESKGFPVTVSVILSLGFIAYFVLLLQTPIMQKVYRNGWHAVAMHVFAAILLLLVGFAWYGADGFGIALGIILLNVCITVLVGGGFTTDIGENTMKYITLFSQPMIMGWIFRDFVELKADPNHYEEGRIDGHIFREEEIYVHADCHDGNKLVQAPRNTEAERELLRQYYAGEKTVYFKRPTTVRELRGAVVIRMRSFYMTDEQQKELQSLIKALEQANKQIEKDNRETGSNKKLHTVIEFPYVLTTKQVFADFAGKEVPCDRVSALIRRKQLLLQKKADPSAFTPGSTLSDELDELEHLYQQWTTDPAMPSKDAIDSIGVNFWAHVETFFFKYPGKPKKRVYINRDTVVKKKVVNIGIPSRIVSKDVGAARLFGSKVYVGPWPFYQVHKYSLKWESPDDFAARTEVLDHMKLNDDIYVVRLRSAEDVQQVKMDFILYVTIRIVNPYNALFRIQRWLENVNALIETNYREMVSTATFEQIYKSRDEFGTTWWEVFQSIVCDPKGAHLERRYGIKILIVKVKNVELADPETKRRQELVYQSERDAEAVRIKAQAEHDRIEKVFETIISRGDSGLLLRYFETLVEAGKGEGNWVIPVGSIQHIVDSIVTSKDKAEGYAGLVKFLDKAGLTPEQGLALWNQIQEKKDEVSS